MAHSPGAIVRAVKRCSSLAAAIVIAVLAAGCSVDGDDDNQMVRTANGDIEQLPNGKLERTPPPLTLAAVERERKGSVRAVLMELFFWAQWGSAPNLVDPYDPAVVRSLGVRPLTGAFSLLRTQLADAQPRVISTARRNGLAFVAVELASKENEPQRESFLLRRVRGDWKIVFDTLLERGLKSWGEFRAAGRPRTSPAAAAALGDRVAERYRSAFLARRLSRVVPARSRELELPDTTAPAPAPASPQPGAAPGTGAASPAR